MAQLSAKETHPHIMGPVFAATALVYQMGWAEEHTSPDGLLTSPHWKACMQKAFAAGLLPLAALHDVSMQLSGMHLFNAFAQLASQLDGDANYEPHMLRDKIACALFQSGAVLLATAVMHAHASTCPVSW